eukprot:TRINITY_DN6283_c0_g1_i1.p1 TRINITY_DN6283_c0_g1~~TRINITY_DN6283_c0_g1_i1.p1  ORF type:complete len:158 (+),score=53.77 TRINITY_DN6283_c0_g1_i1:264-737(+)
MCLSGNGYSNLVSHIHSKHANYEEEIAQAKARGQDTVYFQCKEGPPNSGTLIAYIPLEAIKIASYADWVTSDLLPFSFVERDTIRKYSRLEKISVETLMKYLNLICKRVEQKVQAELPRRFGICFNKDLWNEGTVHEIMRTLKEDRYQRRKTLPDAQ